MELIAYYDMAASLGWRELVLPPGTMLLMVNMAERKFRWQDGDARATAHDSRGAALLGASAGPIVVGGAGPRADRPDARCVPAEPGCRNHHLPPAALTASGGRSGA